jgi:hypothetical protein
VHPLLLVHPPRLRYQFLTIPARAATSRHRLRQSRISHGATPVHARRPHLPYQYAGSLWLSFCPRDGLQCEGENAGEVEKPTLRTRCTRIGLDIITIIARLLSVCDDAPTFLPALTLSDLFYEPLSRFGRSCQTFCSRSFRYYCLPISPILLYITVLAGIIPLPWRGFGK